jgi:hypothetical protein
MFIDMILKTIPRSLRAAAALVVMLICLQQGLTSLQALVTAQDAPPYTAFKFGLAVLVGTAAAVAFYYFQSVDGKPAAQHKELETLNRYHEAERRQQELASHTAKPVFSSHDGAIRRDEPAPGKSERN